MDIRTIKGINSEKWREFKAIAARKNVPMGVLFEIMLENYMKEGEGFWKDILSGDRVISDYEAEELYKSVKKLRKDKGFRI